MKRRCLGCMEQYDDKFKVCPHCGYVVGTCAEEAIQMQPGTLLHDRYIIGKVIGSGGFGVTYLAWDGRLEQKVAIKEYLPGEFSTRMPGSSLVTVFNGDKGEQFRDGMKKLIEESKRLSKFQNEPGIVKIFDCFEENQTAYIVMEYLDGMTLASYLETEGTIPEDKAVSMLMPVMASLQTVHEAGLLHRDIAPDNIFLTRTGEVKLIDFGAARYATTTHSRSLTVIIKPGYSPEEQYRSNGNQGAHTDVHALAATLYKMITGVRPADAMDRYSECETKGRDLLLPLHKFDKSISKNRENAILNGLNVRIEDRTADIVAFMDELNSEKPVKRRYGKIKKIDIYSWPLWVKILIPVAVAAIAIFGILLGTGVIQFDSFSIGRNAKIDGYATVPNVVRMSEKDAKKELEEAGFNYIVSDGTESEIIEKGTICTQDPSGGSYREIGIIIECSISQGNGEVIEAKDGISYIPFFKGYDVDETIERFTKAGLVPVFEEVESDYEAGLVCEIQTGYSEGQEVPEGTEIILMVSIGRPIEVPNVEGLTEEAARSILLNLGLDVGFDYVNDDNVPDKVVILQSTPQGEVLHKGDVVTLTVSTGEEMFVIPDVIGKTEDEAKTMINNKVKSIYEYSSNDAAGQVIRIDEGYKEGDSVPKSKTLVIVVSLGNKPVKVTFDANGGKLDNNDDKTKDKYLDLPYGEMPKAERDGYEPLGWFTDEKSGKEINPDDTVEVDVEHTLYAHWKAKTYTITFNANGGSVSPTSKTVTYGSDYGELPTPTKAGYGFEGWYDSKTGENKVSPSTTFSKTSNQTLYARWEADAYNVSWSTDTGYIIAVNRTSSPYANASTGSLDNGAVVYYGDVLSVTYTASTGYSISSKGSTSITVNGNVTSSNIYATVSVNSYTASWNTGTGYSITVRRTSSPRAGASIGTISSGAKVYYGDVLSVTYAKQDYYTIISKGSTSITVTGNVTSSNIYATATPNSVSGWVKASEMPSGTQVINTKWTYTLREYGTNSASSVSGWTKYDTKRTGWGPKQGPVYSDPSNGSRNVWSEKYVTSSNYKTVYNYYYYSKAETGYATSYYPTNTYGKNKYSVTLDSELSKTGTEYKYNGYTIVQYKMWHTNNTKWRHVYACYAGEAPYEYKSQKKVSDNYGTRWYYQEPVYTYYYYRDLSKEATSDPTGQSNVSNVVKWVQYRAK